MGGRYKSNRQIHMEYSHDRLSSEKLSQAYRLLMPDHTWPIGKRNETVKKQGEDDEIGGDLRKSLLGDTKG
jgi:hypothetical protein